MGGGRLQVVDQEVEVDAVLARPWVGDLLEGEADPPAGLGGQVDVLVLAAQDLDPEQGRPEPGQAVGSAQSMVTWSRRGGSVPGMARA